MESPRHPVAGVDYPRTFQEFDAWFGSEMACREYIRRLRWPDGFVCPHCGAVGEPWEMSRSLLRCRACDRQVSLTAGTVLRDTRKPLRMWFLAMWFVTSQKNGVSALGLQRVLGLGSYETAWTWLHKLRRARWSALAAIASPARSRSTRLTSAARKRESADVRPRTRPLSLWRQGKVVVASAASACAASRTDRRTV